MPKINFPRLVVEGLPWYIYPFSDKNITGQQVQADTYMKQLNLNPYSPAAVFPLTPICSTCWFTVAMS